MQFNPELSYSNAITFADNLIRIHNFLKDVETNFDVTYVDPKSGEMFTDTVQVSSVLSFRMHMLYGKVEAHNNVRIFGSSFFGFNAKAKGTLRFYKEFLEYEDIDHIDINDECEYFQYCTIYSEDVVFALTAISELHKKLPPDAQFYFDLSDYDIMLDHINRVGEL